MVRMGKLALVLLLAIYVVNADTTSSEVTPLGASELGHLSALESRLSRSAAGMMKGLLGADAVTNDASPARRLGEGRVEAGRGTGQSAERSAQKVALRTKLQAVEASIHQMEAGAGTVLGRDKQIGQMAMRKAVTAEQRRETTATKGSATDSEQLLNERSKQGKWIKHVDTALQQVESEATEETIFDRKALSIENKMQQNQRSTGQPDVRLPTKELAHSEKFSTKIKSQLGEIENKAQEMRSELTAASRPATTSLGESPEKDDTLAHLHSQLKDAEATKQMLEQSAMGVVNTEHQQEHAKIQKKLSEMRTDFTSSAPVDFAQVKSELRTEHQKDAQLQQHTHKNLRWMEQVTAHVQQGAAHQFAEFNSILESSHSTRHKADQQVTDLEAMMTALKTKRSQRLQGEV